MLAPGEDWRGGSVLGASRETPSLTLPRSTGGGDKSDGGSAAALDEKVLASNSPRPAAPPA